MAKGLDAAPQDSRPTAFQSVDGRIHAGALCVSDTCTVPANAG